MPSSSRPSTTILRLALLLIVVRVNIVASHNDLHKERTFDGAVSPNQEDEDHSFFEHSAILGSKKEVEQFEDLSPGEARKRLRGIAKRMDEDGDGSVDKDELKNWILKSFESLALEESAERFEDADLNKDKLISWQEHFSESFGEGELKFDTIKESKAHNDLIDEERELFELADIDDNGFLTKEEYARLSQPQEYAEMHQLVVTQAMRKKDADRDGKVSLEEFLKDEKLSKEHLLEERERFQNELDKNKDSLLNFDEFTEWVIPNNNKVAELEAEHLFERADDNRDGKLSYDEIVDNKDAFVSSEATDYGEHLVRYKDEL